MRRITFKWPSFNKTGTWASIIGCVLTVLTFFGITYTCQDDDNNNEAPISELVDETNNTLEEPEIELPPTAKDESNSITQSSKDRELAC